MRVRLGFGIIAAALAALCVTLPGAAQVKVDPNLPRYKVVDGVSGRIKSVGSDTMNNEMTLWAEGFGKGPDSRTRDYFVGKTADQPVQFNTNAFAMADEFTFGNAARNYIGITAPPNLMEDFDAMKTFHVGERVRAVLRVDYFNAFNRTQFGSDHPPVDNTIEDSSFGMVQGTSSNIPNRQGQATLRIQF